MCAFHVHTLPTFQGEGKIAVLKNGRKISYGLSYTPETSRISLRHGYEDVKLSYGLSYHSATN